MTRVRRETRETQIRLEVTRDPGALGAHRVSQPRITTGDDFLDHMLVTLSRYAGIGLHIEATGDLRHHLVEDVAIALGAALKREIPAEAERFGWAVIPMDEALVEAAIDVGGRPYYVGRLPSALYEHFLQSFAFHLGATLHVTVRRGRDRHHIVEAAVKATGLALRQAMRQGDQVFSTKGSVALEFESEDEG
jgi:imidazoleglycerol-phosphate dehydratase